MLSGIYAFGQEPAPPPAPSPGDVTPCMNMQKEADKIIQTANSFDKPSLKNPAIEKHVLKAMEYVQACDLQHALNSLDALDAILNQPKYNGILDGSAITFRSYLIACYNYHCTNK